MNGLMKVNQSILMWSLTAAMSVMVNYQVGEEKQKHNPSHVLGPLLLCSLFSVSKAVEVGEHG